MPTQPRTALVVTLTPAHLSVDYQIIGRADGQGTLSVEVYYADPIDTRAEPSRLVDGYLVSDSTGTVLGVVSEGAGGNEWDYQLVRGVTEPAGVYRAADELTMLAAAGAHPRYLLRTALWGGAPTRDKCLANMGMVVLP